MESKRPELRGMTIEEIVRQYPEEAIEIMTEQKQEIERLREALPNIIGENIIIRSTPSWTNQIKTYEMTIKGSYDEIYKIKNLLMKQALEGEGGGEDPDLPPSGPK